MSEKINSKRKKLLLRAICVIAVGFLVLGAVLMALKLVSNNLSDDKNIVHAEEIYPTITPYEPRFEEDVTKVEDYMSLNTMVMYKFPDANLYAIKDIPPDMKNGGMAFFEEYFKLLKGGEYEKYSNIFCDTYKKNPSGFEKDVNRKFPPQKVYDIVVEQLLVTEGDGKEYTYEKNDCEFGIYRVSYKILRNDGYFRPDLYKEDIVRPLIFELVTFNEGKYEGYTLIKNLYTETSIEGQGANT